MRDIDIEIAQALGWVDIIVADDTGRIRMPLDQWREQNPNAWPIYLTGRSPETPDWPSSVVPHYEEDIDWLEDEVEKRGIQVKYIQALFVQLGFVDWDIVDGEDEGGGWMDRESIFLVLRATSDQRVQAFLKALKP